MSRGLTDRTQSFLDHVLVLDLLGLSQFLHARLGKSPYVLQLSTITQSLSGTRELLGDLLRAVGVYQRAETIFRLVVILDVSLEPTIVRSSPEHFDLLTREIVLIVQLLELRILIHI